MIITKKLVPWAYQLFFFWETKKKRPEFILHITRELLVFLQTRINHPEVQEKIRDSGYDLVDFDLSEDRKRRNFGAGKCCFMQKASDGDYFILSFSVFKGDVGETVNPYVIFTLALLLDEGNRYLHETYRDDKTKCHSIGAQHVGVNLSYDGRQFSCDFSITMHRMLMGARRGFRNIETMMAHVHNDLTDSDVSSESMRAEVIENDGRFYAKLPGMNYASLVLRSEVTGDQLASRDQGYSLISKDIMRQSDLFVLLVAVAELHVLLITDQERGKLH